MMELVAIGPESSQHWRRPVPDDRVVCVGRAPRHGWAVPWDGLISREHAHLTLEGSEVHVTCLETARNPIFFRGTPSRDFTLAVGEEFRIGRTAFQLVQGDGSADSSLVEERAFHADELQHFEFRNASHRLEVLTKLPQLISRARDDEDFATRLVNLLLDAIPHADAVAVMQYEQLQDVRQGEPRTMRWVSRQDDLGRFRPSRRLVRAALSRKQTMLHVWADDVDQPGQNAFTAQVNLDWAFVTPVNSESCQGWCLYVTGKFQQNIRSSRANTADELKGDLRFTELLAQIVGSVKQVRWLEASQAGMSQFFSPSIMETLTSSDSVRNLRPRETEITVLFCDVRGFSRKAEESQHDLHGLLGRVSQALSVMTKGIIRFDGAIADFQGDAALGFWGWPSAPPDGPLAACRAALDIRAEFAEAVRRGDGALADFQVGIGIAHGRAIAGKIGTTEQIKVGVFGPVVNLGSRLEGMTKHLRASVIVDEQTGEYVRRSLPPSEGRCRRLARVRPQGVLTAVMVYELLPPASEPGTLSDEHLAQHDAAVEALGRGDWTRCLELLSRLPTPDPAADFLADFVRQRQARPPADWDGVVAMTSK